MSKETKKHLVNVLATMIVVLLILFSVGLYALMTLTDEVTIVIRIIIYVLVAAMVVIVIATSLMIVFAAGKRMVEAAAGSLIASASALGQVQEVRARSRTAKIEARKLEAQARKAEREADVLTIIARRDEAVYIRDAGHIPWRPAHLDPRTYANGRASLRSPSPLELSAWNNWHISRQITDSNPRIELDRPQTSLPDRIDLLDWLPASRQGNLRSIFFGVAC